MWRAVQVNDANCARLLTLPRVGKQPVGGPTVQFPQNDVPTRCAQAIVAREWLAQRTGWASREFQLGTCS
jgi:hypothetical protein